MTRRFPVVTEKEAEDEFHESVDRLVDAAHRMVKWTSVMKGEDGGAFVHAMKQASRAEGDVWTALGAWGISMSDRAPDMRWDP